MFPDVAANDGRAFTAGDGFAHERIVLVGGGDDFQLALVGNEPDPAAAKTRQTGGLKLGFEIIEVAKRSLEVIGEFASRRAAGLWPQNFPEKGMVPVAAAVVAHRAAYGVGDHAQIPDDL